MRDEKKVYSDYAMIEDRGEKRYRFFCDASGAAVYTSQPIVGDGGEAELEKVWEEAKLSFNKCAECGRFVCDAMYNADTFMCVDCSPWENPPKFCKHCGQSVLRSDTFCRKCGAVLRYEEE